MSTFDPLGILSFYKVAENMILREAWRRDCRWDDKLHMMLKTFGISGVDK